MQIIKGMTLGYNLQALEKLYKLYDEIGPIVITADTVCAVCKNAVDNAEFIRTADGRIAHLHCGSMNNPS